MLVISCEHYGPRSLVSFLYDIGYLTRPLWYWYLIQAPRFLLSCWIVLRHSTDDDMQQHKAAHLQDPTVSTYSGTLARTILLIHNVETLLYTIYIYIVCRYYGPFDTRLALLLFMQPKFHTPPPPPPDNQSCRPPKPGHLKNQAKSP